MINFKETKEIENKLVEIDALLSTFGDYKASHHCKLGADAWKVEDLEKYFNKVKKMHKDEVTVYELNDEIKDIYQELNDSRDEINTILLACLTYYRAMIAYPFGELTSDIFIRVVKHLLMTYNEVFNDVQIVDVFNKKKDEAIVILNFHNEEAFVQFMLVTIKEAILELKNK